GVDDTYAAETILNIRRGFCVDRYDVPLWVRIEDIKSKGTMRKLVHVITRKHDQPSVGGSTEVKRSDPFGPAYILLATKCVSFAFKFSANRQWPQK
ncbi:MAG: hypothetical protein ABSF22_16800, partial [Bryobacteraceae bacterium]